MWLRFSYALAIILVTTVVAGPVDKRIRKWCKRRAIRDRSLCFETLHRNCQQRSKRSTKICKAYRRYASQRREGSPPFQGTLQSAPSVEHDQRRHQSIYRTPRKADPHMMRNLKDASNKFVQSLAQRFIGQIQGQINGALGNTILGDLIQPKRRDPTIPRQPTEADINAPLQDNYWETDIDLTTDQAQGLLELINELTSFALGGGKRKKRKTSTGPSFKRWKTFPIAYEFNPNVVPATRSLIKQAIKLWERNTCIRWQENGPGVDKVKFINGPGCSSYVGRSGGTQLISIQTPGCDRVGIISHEIGHSLGFFHEQNRPDQKQNVQINYPNIYPQYYNNFLAAKESDVNYYDEPYDHGSVMHYDAWTKGFTVFPTDYAIISNDPGFQNTMGQRNGPSFIDFKQVNKAYCAGKCSGNNRCQNQGYPDPNRCSRCKCPVGLGGKRCHTVQRSTKGCGGLLKASGRKQIIGGKRFSYGDKCYWLIRANKGQVIRLQFVGDFSFTCNQPCSGEFIEIKRGPGFQSTGYRICCNRPEIVYHSKGHEMVIILHALHAAPQFTAEFRSEEPASEIPKVKGPSGPQPQPQRPQRPQPIPVRPIPRPSFGFTTPRPIPNTYAPKAKCKCKPWSGWTRCDSDCGGCGFQERQRRCRKKEHCERVEKRRCNFSACNGATDGVSIRNRRVNLMYKGCCIGLFNNRGVCGGIARTIQGAIQNVFSGR